MFSVRVRADPQKIMKIPKQKIILGLPIAFVSIEAYIGAIIGYFLTNFVAGKEPGQMGKIRSLVFNVGNRKLHLHHWILCLGFLISAVYFDFNFLLFPQFSLGFLGGAIFQGISNYPDWYKIVTKNKVKD